MATKKKTHHVQIFGANRSHKKRISVYEGNQTLQVGVQFHLINQTSTSAKVRLIHPFCSGSILIWLATLKINPMQQNQKINGWPSKINATLSWEQPNLTLTSKPTTPGALKAPHSPSRFSLQQLNFKSLYSSSHLSSPLLASAPAEHQPCSSWWVGKERRCKSMECLPNLLWITIEDNHHKTTKEGFLSYHLLWVWMEPTNQRHAP